MKNMKKVLALVLSIMFVVLCFTGCSSSAEAEEITDKTLLIAYTNEVEPFIYTDAKTGKLTGFDVEVIKSIFKGIKNDYKNYEFVQVEEGYRLGEDPAYTDKDGNSYVAYIQVGGLQKDQGTFNEDYTMSKSIIDNRVITVTAKGSSIGTYADLDGRNVGVVSNTAVTALDKHNAIKSSFKSLSQYTDAKKALADLDSGKLDAVVIDEFSFRVLDNKDNYVELKGELDTVNYVYVFKKWDWYEEAINQAIMELQSPEYNDADEFTPIVEKYFGYDASNFTYEVK